MDAHVYFERLFSRQEYAVEDQTAISEIEGVCAHNSPIVTPCIKAVCHCSRFARAGGANKFQLLLWVSNLSVFCPVSVRFCARGYAWKSNYIQLSWRARVTDFSRD